MTQQAPLVMFVDDNEAFLEVVEPVIQAQGYRVLCCTGPEEALARMRAERPHVVITDVMMAGLDSGFSFSRQIKEDPLLAGIPVIIVTAISSRRGFNFNPRTPEELAAMHADAFLGKPVAPLDLLAKIQELVARAAGAGGSQ
jgi:CheY-like chemotaxis protein